MSDLEKITELCVRLGAPTERAEIMAKQLLKRADQLSAERGIRREEAMAQLLQILVQGSQGEVPPAFRPPAAASEEQA